ncbi:MAG: protoporphyrinogen oxidase [Thermodesulfovibrionales bacterium]|nr:protoporphyrinogen oxidase [Thermodesulfovibrionales bacterium]
MTICIIGGGISGLSLAFFLSQADRTIEINVYESQDRIGGKIWTDRRDGFVCEAGVNGFLDNKPATLELSKQIGINPVRSNDNSRRRFIYLNGKLREIPDKPLTFLFSDFLSLSGRLNMVMEFMRPPRSKDDESMQDFALRRVGREFFEKLLDPLASGIYAGDPSKLSIRSCFTKVYDLERNYGGLIKGFIALAKEKKKAGKKVEAGPGGILHSFENGMYSMIESLRDVLGDRIKVSTKVVAIHRKSDRYIVYFEDGRQTESDVVVLTTPAYETSKILSDLDKELSSLVSRIPYPPLTVVALGYKNSDIKNVDLNGFGFLVPAMQKRRILGTLFDTSIFSKRAPEGYSLLRTMIGGARYPHLAMLDDDKIVNMTIEELSDILGIEADPHLVRIYRWEQAIPQYNVGHYKILEDIEMALSRHKGLYLSGNAFKGVAVNDCIANSLLLSQTIIKGYKDGI